MDEISSATTAFKLSAVKSYRYKTLSVIVNLRLEDFAIILNVQRLMRRSHPSPHL